MLMVGLVNEKTQLIYFLLGFTMFKVMGLNIITITILALSIAYIMFNCTKPSTSEVAMEE